MIARPRHARKASDTTSKQPAGSRHRQPPPATASHPEPVAADMDSVADEADSVPDEADSVPDDVDDRPF